MCCATRLSCTSSCISIPHTTSNLTHSTHGLTVRILSQQFIRSGITYPLYIIASAQAHLPDHSPTCRVLLLTVVTFVPAVPPSTFITSRIHSALISLALSIYYIPHNPFLSLSSFVLHLLARFSPITVGLGLIICSTHNTALCHCINNMIHVYDCICTTKSIQEHFWALIIIILKTFQLEFLFI